MARGAPERRRWAFAGRVLGQDDRVDDPTKADATARLRAMLRSHTEGQVPGKAIESATVAIDGDQVAITVGWLGETSYYPWDGSNESVDVALVSAAKSIAATLLWERDNW
jgi:hypothetical protein